MKVAFDPIYCHPLPEGHRFPMEKYALLPQQLVREGVIEDSDLYRPQALTREEVVRVHQAAYVQKLEAGGLSRQEERRMGFPLSRQLVEREYTICGGSVQNVEHALNEGVALNIAGGTHHAYSDHGEGFCLFNDIALAADYFLQKRPKAQLLVVDLDVHQGNGTAELLQNEPRVFTFSMHGRNNYPLHKEKSDLDVALEDGCPDNRYLELLNGHLDALFDRLRPEFVFFQSGVDVLATDKLGRLGLSLNGCRERDALVFSRCARAGIPVTVCMGGGYSEKLSDILEAHVQTFEEARKAFG